MKRLVPTALLVLISTPALVRGQEELRNPRALEVIQAAIEAMGGEAYLNVRTARSSGRYFPFDRDRRTALLRFQDWTVYEPVKWRFQLGEGKRQDVTIYNLQLEKGWKLEGEKHVEEIPEDQVKSFARSVKKDIDIILKKRIDEEGVSLFYYGPDEIAGAGDYEAVEFLDASNDSIVIYFDRETHLPHKTASTFTNRLGVRLTEEVEFYNWHTFQGVLTPLRYDRLIEGERASQRFVEEIAFNPSIPESYFLKPVPKQ